MSQDPKILYESQTNATLAEYVKGYKECLPELGELNKDQIGEGTYGYEHSGFTWSPEDYIKHLKINEGPGAFNSGDKWTPKIWQWYLDSLKQIKHTHITGDETKDKAFQLSRFKEHHKAFYKTILPKLSVGGFKDLESQTYMEDLRKLGFSKPPWRDTDKLELEEYDKIVKKDFESYLSGGKKNY
jgi:hypothetical protein